MKFNFKKILLSSAVALSSIAGLSAHAGGVASYTGTVSTAGAGISSGAGSSATAVINMDFKVPNFMAIGVYDVSGANSNVIFSAPATNFPGGTTFTAAESGTVLLSNEGNLNSKFDLDGTASVADATTIINAINATSATSSQDITIKGAVFTNAAVATTLTLTTSANSVTLTGGTGSAPTYVFRAVGGVPGGGATAINTQAAPSTTGLALTGARRNANGYARFAVVGDLSETSVNLTTKGNWTGSLTLTLTGI
jgi:hypothetical protein